MKKITINEKEYEVIKDHNDAIDVELLTEKITEYFDGFDYIVGDWAYGKLRLKGFYESDIAGLSTYIETKCAYGCKWFQLKVNK